MAKIGLNNFRYGILTEAPDGTPSYGGAKKPAKAVSCSVDITNNEAGLYADDGLAESDTSFQGGDVTMGIDDEDQATMAELLGHSIVNGALIRNANDVAPYVGFGRIITKMVNNVYKYKVEFLYKTKFSEPSQDDTTKGESIEFGTSELSGKVAKLANDNWSESKTFNTKAEAIAFLEGLLGGAVTANKGAMITLPDGSDITPPTGKVFDGWDTTSSAETGDLRGTYIVTEDVTLYAIYVDE